MHIKLEKLKLKTMSKQTLIILLLSILLRVSCQEEEEPVIVWEYGTEWNATAFPLCFASQQSPIHLVSTEATKEGVPLVTFNWRGGNQFVEGYILHTFTTVFIYSQEFNETTKVGEELYQLLMAYFSWGSDSSKGSKHTVDDTRFAGEIELIHFNTKSDEADRYLDKNALIVSLLLVEGSDEDTPSELKQFQEAISTPIGEESVETPVTENSGTLENILPENREYFYYTGNFAQPPCSKSIPRVVLKNAVKVGPTFLQALRDMNLLNDGTSMSDNFRPTQPTLPDTVVYKSFD